MHNKLSMIVAMVCLLLFQGCKGSDSTEPSADGSVSSRSETASTSTAGSVQSSRASASKASGLQVEFVENPISADGFGALSGRVLLDGKVVPNRLAVTKDQEVCGMHDLVDETYVVGTDGGLANVVVSLYLERGQDPPSQSTDPVQTVTLDNLNCRFEPHVCVVQTGQTLLIGNKDPVGHNTKIELRSNPGINPLIPAGGSLEQQFSQPERRPGQVGCSIHPWMVGWIVVSDHPYVAVTNSAGEFEIKDLPASDWTFQLWHERAGVDRVSQNDQLIELGRGRFTVEIKDGMTANLGEIILRTGD